MPAPDTLPATRNGTGVAPMELDPMTIARAFKESGMFPDLRSEAQAVVKIIAGQEVGFGPMASMQAVQMIQGKPTFSANALAALVKRHPSYNYRSVEHTAEVCRLQFYEDGEEAGVSEFSMEDAKLAGLLGNRAWQKYPKAMLFARALSQGVRWYAPDVTAGAAAYVPEELGGDVSPDETSAAPETPSQESTAAEDGERGLPAGEAEGPDTAEPTIPEDRAVRIEEGIAALSLNYRQINVMLGAAGLDALRANSKKAVQERIGGLTAEQADALEAELKVEAERNV